MAHSFKLPDRLLSAPEAAEMLGLSVGALETQRRRGRIPFVRWQGSRLVKYRLSSLLEFMDQNERQVPPL